MASSEIIYIVFFTPVLLLYIIFPRGYYIRFVKLHVTITSTLQ